ncbi:hypothetical protein BaRGS_00014721 [Batillaria attramentaria]|uniref:Uncharacterized protein n=1 Tax=Batillaria attramentaria TaxID=370345 RepID=A0ABD0L3G7_9CAEN
MPSTDKKKQTCQPNQPIPTRSERHVTQKRPEERHPPMLVIVRPNGSRPRGCVVMGRGFCSLREMAIWAAAPAVWLTPKSWKTAGEVRSAVGAALSGGRMP